MDYSKHFNPRETDQSQPIPGQKMVKNSAGGFVFEVSPWTQFERFLILGAEGGTYYASEQSLSFENATNTLACIEADGLRVVQTIVGVSHSGRAPKNDAALFALALCTGFGNEATRQAAFAALPQVARTGTHLFTFAKAMDSMRGWGRGARKGVGNWFLNQNADRLGFQVLKYAQRDGWSMRDLLRLTHPQTNDPALNAVFHYITHKEVVDGLPAHVTAAYELNDETPLDHVVKSIVEHRLPREAVPTKFLNTPQVWEALLQEMPITAMIRNLGKMTNVGLLVPLSGAARLVNERLRDDEVLQRGRIHPINVLAALTTYSNGKGMLGKLSWNPVNSVVDSLNEAFYKSFKFIEPSGKRILIGLDISGSMGANKVNGMEYLTAREASAAMCMATVRTESNYHVMGFSDKFVPLDVSASMRLDTVVKNVSSKPFGATDCSLPMLWAMETGAQVDAFVIYTDNETWYGKIHPVQALQKYREKTGIPAKMVVCAMTATGFTIGKPGSRAYGTLHQNNPPAIADPMDGGMLDVAGLDSAAPAVIADFVR